MLGRSSAVAKPPEKFIISGSMRPMLKAAPQKKSKDDETMQQPRALRSLL